jgi:hypothetical protein
MGRHQFIEEIALADCAGYALDGGADEPASWCAYSAGRASPTSRCSPSRLCPQALGTHVALDKNSPATKPVLPPGHGRVIALPRVGGLHHRYDRRAA